MREVFKCYMSVREVRTEYGVSYQSPADLRISVAQPLRIQNCTVTGTVTRLLLFP